MKFTKPPEELLKRYKSGFSLFSDRTFASDKNYVLLPPFEKWYPKYKNFQCKPTDVWVASFPKSGTTWTQELVWCIMHDLNLEEAKSKMLMVRFPFFEWDGMISEDPKELEQVTFGEGCSPGEQWKIVNNLPEPRTIKTHLHYELLPDGIQAAKSKIIYVTRDPRDVCVSYYSHSQKFDGYQGSFDEFLKLLIDDMHFYSPYWIDVLDFWNKRHEENMLFLRYEDLKSDLPSQIQKVAKFLGKEVDPSKMDEFVDHLSFDSMKKNKTVNNEELLTIGDTFIPFMRKGKVGDWKSSFTAEQKEAFRKWTLKSLEGTDFPYYQDYD